MRKQLTPKEYADLRGLSTQCVIKRLQRDKPLPGVVNVKRFSRFYVLEADVDKDGKLMY